MAINNQDKTEIHNLPEVTTLQPGMMVAVDSEPTGSKSFNLTTALEGKASAADMTALVTTVSGKADASDVAALETAVSGKADADAMTTALAGKEDKVFIAEYNVTSYDDIETAYNAGKQILCHYTSNQSDLYIKLSMKTPVANGGMMFNGLITYTESCWIRVWKENNETHWYQKNYSLVYQPTNPSNGQVLSYTNDGTVYAWKDINEVPTSTASDSGKVLSVESNGIAGWGNAVGFVKNAGALTDAATITVSNLNNGFATLSTSQAVLTIIDVVGTDEIVNFAIEITPSVNCTLTVQKKIGSDTPVTLKHSVAAGNALEAGKTYQVTAVGNCWTLAEFEA
jgi:hypothetical protein